MSETGDLPPDPQNDEKATVTATPPETPETHAPANGATNGVHLNGTHKQTKAEREAAKIAARQAEVNADADYLATLDDPRNAVHGTGWPTARKNRAWALYKSRLPKVTPGTNAPGPSPYHFDAEGRERTDAGTLVVKIRPTGLEQMASRSVDALAEDGRIYQRAHRLAQIVTATPRAEQDSAWTDEEGKTRYAVRAGTPMVDELGRPTLTGMLDTAAVFLKFDARVTTGNPWKGTTPPENVVALVHEWKRWDGIPPLVGVADSPILRRDGTVCQEAGYDRRSGWWITLNDEFPEIPENPTQEDSRRAYAELAKPFADFPYVLDSHRAVPVAAILTVLARAAIAGSVPVFIFDAASGRTGKTLQTDIVSYIATGRFAARKAYPPTDEECEKVLAGYAMIGTSLVCIDDIKRPFGGEMLDMVVTAREEVDFRILGKTDTRRVPWQAVLLATGNNIGFQGQMAARSCMARMESPLERPQDRADFAIQEPLTEYVRRERVRLVAAALTILRAWTCKKLPPQLGRWGGFDEWMFVAEAIVFAGGPNVLDARPPDDGDINPEAEALADIVRGLSLLETQTGNVQGMTSSEIRAELYERASTNKPPDELRAMADTLRGLTRTKPPGDPTAAAIGYAIRKFKGRPVRIDGQLRKLVALDGKKGAGTRWQIWKIEEKPRPASDYVGD